MTRAPRKKSGLRADVERHLATIVGAALDFPFGPETAVWRVGGKIFALVEQASDPGRVSVKLPPAYGLEMRAAFPGQVIPGYHLNKTHWNTVVLDGTPPIGEVTELIDISYDVVRDSLPKRLRP